MLPAALHLSAQTLESMCVCVCAFASCHCHCWRVSVINAIVSERVAVTLVNLKRQLRAARTYIVLQLQAYSQALVSVTQTRNFSFNCCILLSAAE